jgi:hypothetical protein
MPEITSSFRVLPIVVATPSPPILYPSLAKGMVPVPVFIVKFLTLPMIGWNLLFPGLTV